MISTQNNLAERYARMAWRLNRAAYEQQIRGKRTALKQFIPCARALLFTGALNWFPLPVTNQIMPQAALVMCECHRTMGEADLWVLWDEVCKEIPLPAGDYAGMGGEG